MRITIWAVENGDINDYQVEALYTNEAAAKKHCNQMNAHSDDTYTYSEWGVEDECPNIIWVWVRSEYNDAPYPTYTVEEPRPAQVSRQPKGRIIVVGTDKDEVEAVYQRERTST